MSMETGSAQSPRFKVRIGPWNLNRRRWRILALDHHMPGRGDYIHSSRKARVQMLTPKPPLNAVLTYIAPLVLALVPVRYQGKTKGLFEENPVPTWCFLAATCVYGLIAGVVEQIQTFETEWSQILRSAAIASGVFSIVSLVSMFLPRPVSIAPLIIYTALQSVVLMWPIICRPYNLIKTRITSVFDNIRAKVTWSRGCNLRNEVGLPV